MDNRLRRKGSVGGAAESDRILHGKAKIERDKKASSGKHIGHLKCVRQKKEWRETTEIR